MVGEGTNISYCGDLVRRHDPDRFLISMFAPADTREYLWSLFAFNHEIAKTRAVVSDTTLGLIRLQWWRDAIEGIYSRGEVLEHEVLKPLVHTIERHNLPRELFDKLIYAREFDLEGVLPANLEGLMNYAEFTSEPLLKLAVQICGSDPDQEIIQPVAVNYSLAGILRATAYWARDEFFLLPEDLMKKHGLTKESLLKEDKGLKSLVKDIIDQKLPKASPDNGLLKACQTISEIYFKQIAVLDYDVMSPAIQREPSLKVLRVWWNTKIL